MRAVLDYAYRHDVLFLGRRTATTVVHSLPRLLAHSTVSVSAFAQAGVSDGMRLQRCSNL